MNFVHEFLIFSISHFLIFSFSHSLIFSISHFAIDFASSSVGKSSSVNSLRNVMVMSFSS